MGSITLVRHGQANSQATTEAEYDKLSDLGLQQAAWLGEHMRETGQHYDAVYTGSLHRQQQTAIQWGAAQFKEDARFDEMRYFGLAEQMRDQFGVAVPKGYEEFSTHLPITFAAWSEGKIDNPPETFQSFQQRISSALYDVAEQSDHAIIFTSGGVIGMAMQLAMDLDIGAASRTVLSVMNSSVHRLRLSNTGVTMMQFNVVSHLEPKDRRYAQTYF